MLGSAAVAEEAGFRRVDQRADQRLAEVLPARNAAKVAATQAEFAIELGMAREVVTRRLAAVMREGLVALGRGTVTIADRQGLRARADGG